MQPRLARRLHLWRMTRFRASARPWCRLLQSLALAG
jgi:hypothetical protein